MRWWCCETWRKHGHDHDANACRIGVAAGTLFAGATFAHAADVSPELIAKAKQEGQLNLLHRPHRRSDRAAARRRLRGEISIKVSFARADSQVNIIKLMNEHRADG